MPYILGNGIRNRAVKPGPPSIDLIVAITQPPWIHPIHRIAQHKLIGVGTVDIACRVLVDPAAKGGAVVSVAGVIEARHGIKCHALVEIVHYGRGARPIFIQYRDGAVG